MRRLPIAFILAIFLPLICACGDEPRDYGDFLTNIVTYEGSSDDGTAMFSFQSRDDLPLQRLASSIKLPSDIVAGQRCLLRYTVVGNLADGTRQVRADGFAIIPTDGARKAPHSDMSTFPETEISVTSLWRSGTFINLNGWLPYSGKNCRRRADARQPDNRGAHCLQHDGRADIVRPPCICLFRRFCPMEPRHMPPPVDRHRRPHVRL